MQLNPQAATQAYIDTLSVQELALARDYTSGNHWLILVGLLVSALVTWLIVRSGVLDKLAGKLAQRSFALRAFLIAATFVLVDALLSLPFAIYQEWWREGAYGLTSQPLPDFLVQSLMSIVINALILGLFLLGVYALIRKTKQLWWLWSGALVAVGAAFLLLVSPVLIEPLFNDYQPIPEGEVHDAVMELAAAAGVPESRVFMYDGSRQSNNFTANVAGIGSSARIAISDVAMGDASLDEVKAVTGHEIGHYMSGHIWRMLAVLSLLAIGIFFALDRLYPWFARRFGTDAVLSDPRGVPVFAFVFGLLFTIAQPITNGVIRVGEREADIYSMENVGLPDAMAGALLQTAEYRYPLAGPVEEAIFYTHPTVESRIRAAMEWKAANGATEATE